MNSSTRPRTDDACADFVHWLTTKTLEGEACWEKNPNGLIVRLSDSMFAQFITHVSEQGDAWSLFRVRDVEGELFRARASAAGVETAPLAIAVQALFFTLMWAGWHFIH